MDMKMCGAYEEWLMNLASGNQRFIPKNLCEPDYFPLPHSCKVSEHGMEIPKNKALQIL